MTENETLTDCVCGSIYALTELADKLPSTLKDEFRRVLAQFVNNNYIWKSEEATGKYLS